MKMDFLCPKEDLACAIIDKRAKFVTTTTNLQGMPFLNALLQSVAL